MPEDISAKIRYSMGSYALGKASQRYITKDEFKSALEDLCDFKKFEPLFDYFDKFDNQKLINDGQIDLGTFASGAVFEYHRDKYPELSNVGYYQLFDNHALTGDTGLNEKNVSEICTQTGTKRDDIVNFIKILFNLQKNGEDTFSYENYKIERKYVDSRLKSESI